MFQGGTGEPLNLDNVARRIIKPAIERCTKCQQPEAVHPEIGHAFELDTSIAWHGWHAYRRGLATILNELGVDAKTIQAIMRHSNIKTTMNIYVKSVDAARIKAMDLLGENFAVCTENAPTGNGLVN